MIRNVKRKIMIFVKNKMMIFERTREQTIDFSGQRAQKSVRAG